jgi:hypothetical protein
MTTSDVATAEHGDRDTVSDASLARLYEQLRGEVVQPGDPRYDVARRVWNGSIDRRPAAVARCVDATDVAACVRFARATELPLAVRSGGHSFPGHSVADGALVVDLGAMKGIGMDPTARTARVEAGVLLGELDRETQSVGLAAPMGAVTHTGVAGLTLGGGIGWIMRHHGLAVDRLLGAEVVTAEGELVGASAEEHPDLFWGLRGGGGNFGIVTEFEFAVDPVGPVVLAGALFWPLEAGEEVARFYRDWSREAPDELTTALAARRAPALPAVPPELHGRHVISVVCCYSGPVEEGERIIRPLREFGPPLLDLCAPKPYLEHQAMFDPVFAPGLWAYLRAHDVAELSDELLGATIEHAGRMESDRSSLVIWQLGGAVGRVGEDETAFSSRSSSYIYNITGATRTAEGFDGARRWVRDFSDAVAPFQSSVYVNFLMDEGLERVRAAYGERRYERLRAVKRTYDPDNLFHLNQNIPPADGPRAEERHTGGTTPRAPAPR